MQQNNEFPNSWKEAYIHFVPKADGSLRPIALTSSLCKLYETLVKNRLQWWVEFNDLLPPNQSGFRKGKSCEDNLINLSMKINEAFLEKKTCASGFCRYSVSF